MIVNAENKLVIKAWANEIEASCIEQANNLANLPFAFHHIALMPDCHAGMGMPIGGVLATDNVVIPNAVGVDIGCGMIACRLSGTIPAKDLPEILTRIRQQVPVGFKHHRDSQINFCGADGRLLVKDASHCLVVEKEWSEGAGTQLGTLGGGNHFIELQEDEQGNSWVMIHTGSRNIGKKVCDYYNMVAKNSLKKWHSSVPLELAFLPLDAGFMGQAYLEEMEWCMKFAQINRDLIMTRVLQIVRDVTTLFMLDSINIHHNYASLENHFGKNVYVHRKGAIRMREGEIGIIPGSMGTPSYIVKGLGNADSFCSASHGAGRTMSRTQADKLAKENLDEVRASMKDIIHTETGKYDEYPMAYKNIDEVIENEKDLVTPIVKLRPVAVVKG